MILSRWPFGSPVLDNNAPRPIWEQWLSALVRAVNLSPSQIADVTLTEQDGAVTTTTVPVASGQPTEGLYRVSWYLNEIQAAPTSSSVQVTIGWTDDGVAHTKVSPALTTNTVGDYLQDTVFLHVDNLSNFTYSIAYTSS